MSKPIITGQKPFTHVQSLGPGKVTAANDASLEPLPGSKLFLDVHRLEPGKVTPEAVAQAHQKDLETQDKHHANFINYWFDEASGTVMCLIEAPNAEAAVAVHREAHGLLPDSIDELTEGH